MYDAIDNSQGTAAETAAAMDTGIGGAFRLTESALEGVKHALGDALTPTLKELADEIQRVAGTTSAWIAENKETVVWIAKAAAVATVAGGSTSALGQGAKTASSTFSALRTVGQGYVGVLNALTGSSNAATRAARAREIAQKKLAVATKAQAQLDRAYAAETKANAAARALGLELTKAETAAAKARFVGERLSFEAQADSIRGAYNLAAAKRQEIADKFDAYAEAQKTIAAASSDPNAEAIRARNVADAQERAALDTRRVNFEERLDGISKIGSGRTEARRDLGWAQARNAAANMALAKATAGRFTAEEKQEAFDKKRAADRSVADAEKELRAAKLSKDATRIKAAEDKLADARDLADAETTSYASFDVETARGLVRQTANEVKGFAFEASRENADAAYARFIAANEALDDAYASGDEKQIEAAEACFRGFPSVAGKTFFID